MSARRQTADQRRESVLAAATTAFAAKGLYGTTTEEIARRAGISQPYVFRLFGSKMNLFIAVLARALLDTDDHHGREGGELERILLHALAARDEPRVRAQLLAAQARPRVHNASSDRTDVGIHAIVVRFVRETARREESPSPSGTGAQPE
jgi:AcrR family transcriptional regulator